MTSGLFRDALHRFYCAGADRAPARAVPPEVAAEINFREVEMVLVIPAYSQSGPAIGRTNVNLPLGANNRSKLARVSRQFRFKTFLSLGF